MFDKLDLHRHATKVWIFFAVIYGLTIFINDGFMASDDYWVGIIRYIPAQTSHLSTLVGADDVKSPLQLLPFFSLAKVALRLGIENPYLQYRFALAFLSLLNVTLLVAALAKFKSVREIMLSKLEAKTEFLALLFLFAFYFVMPFAMTRPMFETLAAPWLLLSAIYTYSYDQFEKKSDLLWSVLFVSVAFCLRVQVGICALVVVLIPLLKQKWKDASLASLLGLGLFLISGLPDLFIRGHFHQSMIALIQYNFAHGSEYGNQPWHYYLDMLIGLVLMPFFVMKYSGQWLKEKLKERRVFLLFLLFFVLLHNMFPQKFERFLISILPILLFIIFPVLQKMWTERSQRKMRMVSLFLVNFLFWLPATFSRVQNAIIDLSLFLADRPNITKVYRYEGRPEWIADVFAPNFKGVFVDVSAEKLNSLPTLACGSELILVPSFLSEQIQTSLNLQEQAKFSSNWIEQLAFKLNPKNNSRRASLVALGCKP